MAPSMSNSWIAVVSAVALLAYVVSAAPPAKCPAGQGLNSAGKCAKCPSGYYSTGRSNKCMPCKAGTESSSSRTYCVPCPALSFSTGGTMCKKCPPGTYSDNIAGNGARKCTKCAKKTFIDKNGRDCSDYIVCQPGKLPMIKYCGTGQCFYSQKKCCVSVTDSTYKCLKTVMCAPGEC